MKRLHLPRYEFTARDVRTGGEWHTYGETKDGTNAAIFASYEKIETGGEKLQ
ncbi:MAG: hypothetical protein QMD71_05665 [bacterium]|nr:hypothetical protein [bacterium]